MEVSAEKEEKFWSIVQSDASRIWRRSRAESMIGETRKFFQRAKAELRKTGG